jgi:hypothetical protein
MKTYPERMDLDAIKQAIEERDEAVRQYHDLAQSMVYHGNSVAHWYKKATAYRDAIGKVWNELQAAGIACDGNKSCAEGVCELAARKASNIQPEPQQVTDEELYDLFDWLEAEWRSNDEREFPLPLFARAVLARYGRPTIQPVPKGVGDEEIDEETATLIPWLLEEAMQAANSDAPYAAGKLTLAAQLLERLSQPEPEDCEENGG